MKTLLTAGKITSFRNEIISLFDYATGVKSIGDFVVKVEELAEERFPNHQFDEKELDQLNSFKGDMLEVLSEIFFHIFSAHPAVGLTDYTPVALSEDYGVDAVGTNVNGDRCAVQDKYRNNPVALITYEDIGKTYSAGRELHQLPLEKSDTIFLFTTGQGINMHCQKVFGQKIRVINRQIISGLIDNNQNFWQQAEELIMDTLDSLQGSCQPF
jgi:glycyl-tRNA synthetase alpha subunit